MKTKTKKFYVSENGNDNNDGSRRKPLATIKKAISLLSKDESEIILQDGVYNENIVLKGSDLFCPLRIKAQKCIR